MPAALAALPVMGNSILSALPSYDYQSLMPHLEMVSLPAGKILYDCGEPIRHVYFPLNSVIYFLATMEDGSTAEVGMVGSEGMLGTCVSMGVSTTPNQAVVLLASEAVRVRAETLKSEFDRGGPLQALLLRYIQSLFVQVSQTAACNRIHHMEVRLCRWLLMIRDRLKSDDLPLTQECVAQMIGVGRPYVTVAAGILEKEGLINCRRGHITILDRAGLEACACECYRIVKEEFNQLFGGTSFHGH